MSSSERNLNNNRRGRMRRNCSGNIKVRKATQRVQATTLGKREEDEKKEQAVFEVEMSTVVSINV